LTTAARQARGRSRATAARAFSARPTRR
jgi:hypothetical protein